MSLAFVCGLEQEAAILNSPAGGVVILSGGSAKTLTTRLEAAIAAGGITGIMSFGTCGALDPSLKAGDVVAGRVIDGPKGAVVCNARWAADLCVATGARMVDAVGSTLTLATAAQKRALFLSSGDAVVDLETYPAALVAARRGLPFAMLRAVSDTATQDIPPAALASLTTAGGINYGEVIGSLMEDDAQIPALMALAESSNRAFEALPQALAGIGVNFGLPF